MVSSKELPEFLDTVFESNPGAVVLEGFNGCILGVAERLGIPGPVLAYDYEACVRMLMERDGMSREGAVEFLEFNTLGAWMGGGHSNFCDTALKTPFSVTAYERYTDNDR